MGAGSSSVAVRAPQARPALLSSSLWSLTAHAVYAGCQAGFLVALARLGEPGVVGRYALATALAAPPLVWAGLQLRVVLATDVEPRFSFATCRKVRVRATLTGLAAVAVLAGVAGIRGEAAIETALVALLKAAENLADLYHGVLQRHECLDRIALACGLKGLASLAAFVGALALGGRLWPALAAALACHALVLALVERPAAQALVDSAERRAGAGSALEVVRFAAPLGLVMAGISLNAAVPRYFIAGREGPAALGYFAALSLLPLLLPTALGAVAQAATARLAAYFRFDPLAFARLTRRLAMLAVAVGLAAVTLGRWILPLAARLFRPDYARQPELLAWLLRASAINGLSGMLGTALTAAQVVRPQAALYGAATAVAAAYCSVFVRPGRPAAGAQALAASALVVAAGQYVLLRQAVARRRRPL